MLLYLFRRFIKIIFYPLIDDSEISIDKKGHKIPQEKTGSGTKRIRTEKQKAHCGKIKTFGFFHKSKLRRNPNFLQKRLQIRIFTAKKFGFYF